MDPQITARCTQDFTVTSVTKRNGYNEPTETEEVTIKGYLVRSFKRIISFEGEVVTSKCQIITPDIINIFAGCTVTIDNQPNLPIIGIDQYQALPGTTGTTQNTVLYI